MVGVSNINLGYLTNRRSLLILLYRQSGVIRRPKNQLATPGEGFCWC